MPAIVDRSGAQAEIAGVIDLDDQGVNRMRDVVIVGLRAQGITFDTIGKVMNISRSQAGRRYNSIPIRARAHYAAFAMG